jgi:hypothetical protein
MARSKKPYPGFRRYVVLVDYGYESLVVYKSSDDPSVLEKARRELPQWNPAKITLFDQENPS